MAAARRTPATKAPTVAPASVAAPKAGFELALDRPCAVAGSVHLDSYDVIVEWYVGLVVPPSVILCDEVVEGRASVSATVVEVEAAVTVSDTTWLEVDVEAALASESLDCVIVIKEVDETTPAAVQGAKIDLFVLTKHTTVEETVVAAICAERAQTNNRGTTATMRRAW